MRLRVNDVLFAVLFVLASVCPTLGTPECASENQKPSVSDVTDVGSTAIPFDDNQDKVLVKRSNGAHEIVQVRLKKTVYSGKLTNPADWPPRVRRWVGSCYEMESTTPGVDYSWYMWLDNVSAGHFKSFITPDGDTYLTWVSRWALCFTEVSTPKDKSKKMDDKLNIKSCGTPGIYSVPVAELLGQEEFVDEKTTAHYVSIYLTSLKKDGNGGFRLVLHGQDPSANYTLVTDKSAQLGWRLVK